MFDYNYRGYYATSPREYLNEFKNGNICIFYSKKNGKDLIKSLVTMVNKDSDIEMYAYVCALHKFGDIDDKHRAFKITRDLAKKGFVPAYNVYGIALSEGDVICQNKKAAFDWFKKASDEGFVIARHNLGICYLSGNGVAKDEATGMSLIWDSADWGYNLSLNTLAAAYYNGSRGYPQDYNMAFEYYSIAARQYDGKAAFALGLMYEKGFGCEQSYEMAFSKYKLAAGLDHTLAQTITGEWLLFGNHVEKDTIAACEFLNEAAENGNELAMYYLGAGSLDGTFWWIEKSEGKEWVKKAAKLGQEDATKLLKKL